MNHVVDSPLAEQSPSPRRSFLVRFVATAVGCILAIFPVAAGLGVLFDPLLRRKRGQPGADADGGKFVRIAPLDLVPPDGMPRQFALSADVTDAWTRAGAQRVGSVFLQREDGEGGPDVTAFSSTCPHLGCAVDFNAADDQFECPCHASAFALDGKKLFGPSLRGLDPLAVKLVDHGGQQEIWVKWQRFRTGLAERVPIG
jgi:quinol---cytochrome c reductase iron-sulfur subunit, bacillus type